MALIGHWVAADGGGAGTNLPDRSASAANGTLTGGCTWVTVNGQAAVRCPDYDYVDVPDHSRWDLVNFTLIVRIVFNSLAGQPGFLSHSPGAGLQPKWIWQYGYGAGASGLHWDGSQTINGTAWTPTIGVTYALALKRSGSDFTFYREGATDGTASNADAFDNATATLKLGYGGEDFFKSDVSVVVQRIYDTALSDADIFTAMTDDAAVPVSVALADTAQLGLTESLTILIPVALSVGDSGSIGLSESVSIVVSNTLALADSLPLSATDAVTITVTNQPTIGDTAALGLSEAIAVVKNPLFLALSDTLGLGLAESVSTPVVLALPDLVPIGLTDSISVEANPALLALTWDELIRGDGEATLHLDWVELSSPASEPAVLHLVWDERQGYGATLRLAWHEVPDLVTPARTAPQKPTAGVTVS